MGNLLPLFLLPGGQTAPSPLLRQPHRTALLIRKVIRLYSTVVDLRQHKAVRHAGAQLLHHVQSQGLPPRAVPVEKAHIGIQAHTLQGGGTVVGEQAVGKGQHGIHRVQGRAAVPAFKGKVLLVLQDHLVQHAEIGRCRRSLQAPQAVQIPLVGDLGQQVLHPPGGRRELLSIQPHPVVPPGALHAPAGVIDLSEDHHPGQTAALEGVVRRPILHPPQQHVPVRGPHRPE